MAIPEESWPTEAETAERWGVTRHALKKRRIRGLGPFPAVLFDGRIVRYRPDDVETEARRREKLALTRRQKKEKESG
jgi:hypothetical protein